MPDLALPAHATAAQIAKELTLKMLETQSQRINTMVSGGKTPGEAVGELFNAIYETITK